jgi:hypothetical protein
MHLLRVATFQAWQPLLAASGNSPGACSSTPRETRRDETSETDDTILKMTFNIVRNALLPRYSVSR